MATSRAFANCSRVLRVILISPFSIREISALSTLQRADSSRWLKPFCILILRRFVLNIKMMSVGLFLIYIALRSLKMLDFVLFYVGHWPIVPFFIFRVNEKAFGERV